MDSPKEQVRNRVNPARSAPEGSEAARAEGEEASWVDAVTACSILSDLMAIFECGEHGINDDLDRVHGRTLDHHAAFEIHIF